MILSEILYITLPLQENLPQPDSEPNPELDPALDPEPDICIRWLKSGSLVASGTAGKLPALIYMTMTPAWMWMTWSYQTISQARDAMNNWAEVREE
jgi:hypothetical protein